MRRGWGEVGGVVVRGVALPRYDGARLAKVRSDRGLSKVSVGQRPAPHHAALLAFFYDLFIFLAPPQLQPLTDAGAHVFTPLMYLIYIQSVSQSVSQSLDMGVWTETRRSSSTSWPTVLTSCSHQFSRASQPVSWLSCPNSS